MAIKSRQKNTRGHREFAALCRQAGFSAVRCVHGELDCQSLPGLAVEIRRNQRLRPEEAMAAAEANKGENIPLVAHRSDHQPWRIILSLSDFFILYRAYLQKLRPGSGSPAAEAYPGSDPGPDHLLADTPDESVFPPSDDPTEAPLPRCHTA